MDRTFPSVCRCEGSLHVLGFHNANRDCLARARGKHDRGVARFGNAFLRRATPSGAVQDAIGEFVTAREFADYPIGISPWNREEDDYESD